jgi:selenide,water dikinase
MAEGSHLVLELSALALPVFPGALDLVKTGVTSGGCNRGKQWFGPKVRIGEGVDAALTDLCFDAETSGGLLLAVPEREASAAQRRLADAGVDCYARIGTFRRRVGDEPLLQFVAR